MQLTQNGKVLLATVKDVLFTPVKRTQNLTIGFMYIDYNATATGRGAVPPGALHVYRLQCDDGSR